MPNKIAPTAKQKSTFMIHLVVFLVSTDIMFVIHHNQETSAGEWTYPWHAWVIAAWFLAVLGHGLAVYANFEDSGLDDFQNQAY